MWFEAHDTLPRHPKTLKLARLIGADRRYAVGLLHDLFSWGLYAADKRGCLHGLDRGDIAAALDWNKKTDIVDALIKSGYMEEIDGEFYIHDWYDYAGKLMDKREADRQRKAEVRRKSTGSP